MSTDFEKNFREKLGESETMGPLTLATLQAALEEMAKVVPLNAKIKISIGDVNEKPRNHSQILNISGIGAGEDREGGSYIVFNVSEAEIGKFLLGCAIKKIEGSGQLPTS